MADVPQFPDADYYDCKDSEELQFESPEEAVSDFLDMFFTPKSNVLAVIREHCPLEVTCHVRDDVAPEWLEAEAERMLESFAESWAENFCGPDGEGEISVTAAKPAVLAVLQELAAAALVWRCHSVATVSLSAEQVEAMMRVEDPGWFGDRGHG